MKSMNTNKVLVLGLASLISFSSAVQAVRFVPSRDQMKNAAYMAGTPLRGACNVVRHPIVNTQKAASFSAKFVPRMSSVKNVAFMIAIQPFLSAYNRVILPTGSAVLRGGKTTATTVASPFTRLWSYLLPNKPNLSQQLRTELTTERPIFELQAQAEGRKAMGRNRSLSTSHNSSDQLSKLLDIRSC